MATKKSEQSPGAEFSSRAGKNRSPKKSCCFAIILVLCGGSFLCSICCARETLHGCCTSGFETRSGAIASTISAMGFEDCEGHSCRSQTHQRQSRVPRENLAKRTDRSPCCSGQARTNGRALLPRPADNRPVATDITLHSAVSENVDPRFQVSRFGPVMNRGSTYLRFCVLLI